MKISRGAIGSSIGGVIGVAVASFIGMGTPIMGGEGSLDMRLGMVMGAFLGAIIGALAFNEGNL